MLHTLKNENSAISKQVVNAVLSETSMTMAGNESDNEKSRCDIKRSPKFNTRYRKWFVFAAGFSTCSLVVSFLVNMSVLYVEWLNEFRKSKSETALIQSVCTGTFYIGGLVSGICITKYGCRNCGLIGGLTASLGILASYFATNILYLVVFLGISGFGFSLSFISAMSSVQMNFEGRWKMITLALIEFGSGLNASLSSLLFELLIQEFGWRGTLLIEGGIMLNILASAFLFSVESTGGKNSGTDMTETKDVVNAKENEITSTEQHQHLISETAEGDDNMSPFPEYSIGRRLPDNMEICEYSEQVICNTSQTNRVREFKNDTRLIIIFQNIFLDTFFVIYVILIATSATAFNSVLIFILDYLTSKDISKPDAVKIFVYMNIVNTVSRIIPGFLKQLPHVSILFIPALSTFLGCIATAALPFIGSSQSLNILAVCSFAFGVGSIATTATISVVKLLDITCYSTGLGMSFAAIGICLVIGGPISGYIRDKTGNYDASLLSASAILFVSCVSFCIMMQYRHRLTRSESTPLDKDMSVSPTIG